MLGVHLLHDHILLQLLRGLGLHAFEHQIGLLKAALADLSLLLFVDALIKVLHEGPRAARFLEQERDLVIATTNEGGGIQEGPAEEGVAFI